MKFLDDKIGKLAEKFTQKAKETLQKDVSKSITEQLNLGLDNIAELALFGLAIFCSFSDSRTEKPTRKPNKMPDYSEHYVINITNNYYGSQNRQKRSNKNGR